jgi:hypothetical protein
MQSCEDLWRELQLSAGVYATVLLNCSQCGMVSSHLAHCPICCGLRQGWEGLRLESRMPWLSLFEQRHY